MLSYQNTSFLTIENDVFSILDDKTRDYPLFLETKTERCYFRFLYLAFTESDSIHIDKHDIVTYLAFICYMIRSNLCFDVALTIPIQKKQSKLALMYGDYYLAKSGISFKEISGFSALSHLLVDTMRQISKSQWLQPDKKVSYKDFYSLVSYRYGSIFYLCYKSPYLLKNKMALWKKELRKKSFAYAVIPTLLKNASLLSILQDPNKRNIELIKWLQFMHKGEKYGNCHGW